MRRLHVVIPFYNEADTLEACVRRVLDAPVPEGWTMALHLVDDHSAEAGRTAAVALVEALQEQRHPVTLHRHEINRGKGEALQTGFDAVLADDPHDDDLVIIQDADLEYDPADYTALMEPLIDGRADAVIGTRWGEHRPRQSVKHTLHELGNRALTILSNLMTGYRVADMECCYKVMPVGVLRALRPMLTESRFGVEPQIVAGLARLGARMVQVPVAYRPRGVGAGKKIHLGDGFRALYVILRERFRKVHHRGAEDAEKSIESGGQRSEVRGQAWTRHSALGTQHAPPPHAVTSSPAHPFTPGKLIIQSLFFLLGLALLGWCIHNAVKGGDWSRLREADGWLIAGLAGCTVVSLLANGMIFWLVIRPVQPLRLRDMQKLNLVTSVLNYAPLRLGLLARVAYHLRVDRMSLLRVGAWLASIACTLLLVVGACTVATLVRPRFDALWAAILLGIVIIGGLLIPRLAGHGLVRRFGAGMDLMLRSPVALWGAIGLRFVDIAAFAGRMACAAAILKIDLAPDRVFLLAMAAIIVSLNPLGRFGFREWAVAVLAGPLGMSGEHFEGLRSQLALIESAGEAIVAVPLGSLALIWYVRRWRAAKR